MQKSFIVYVEGLPGSGKTTLVRDTARAYSDAFCAVPEYIDTAQAHLASRKGDQAYFQRNDETKYQLAKDSGKIALVDRGHLSTVLYTRAYELIKGRPLAETEHWYEQTILAGSLLPDLYVHLKISPDITRLRRPLTLSWDNIWDYEAALDYARHELPNIIRTREHIPIIEIDTTELTPRQVQDALLRHLMQRTHAGVQQLTLKEALNG